MAAVITKLRVEPLYKDARVVFFMDGARYHTSKKTTTEHKKLGAFTIINAP